MEIWETVEFGARAVMLKSAVTKPIKEINRIGRERLESLVEHARTNSEFWREKLAAASDSSFELNDLPTSDKPELMENFDRSVTVDDVTRDEVESFMENESNLGKYFKDKYALSHTSGSQGQPLLLVQSKESLELLFGLQASRGNTQSLTVSEAVKHLVKPARLAVAILKPGFYPSASAFEYMPEGAKKFLEVLRLNVNDEDMIERLNEFRPTHLTAYASVLHEIAREIQSGRLSLQPELQGVVNISERLMPEPRKHYAELFGAPILDNYSMGECLFLTNGCPTSGGMHVNADWAILEVVDENNEPVPDGEKGAKVLVTNLANYVQPIIRYEIGDIVTMATEPCDCGSNMPLIDHVDGRDSEVFHIETKDGLRPLQPTIFELALGRMLDTREYQLIQEENTRFRIRIEPLPGKSFNREKAEKIMREQLKDYGLDQQLEIELEVVDRLAGEGDEKFKRVVSKVKRSDEEKEKAKAS